MTQTAEDFVTAAEKALNERFDGKTFKATDATRRGMDCDFRFDGVGGIPGHPEAVGPYAAQLIPPADTDLTERPDDEHGYYGHDIEVNGETFQVNWLI